ncbi:Very-long-chain 3-oxoacyl-CoA synthase [Purpureocillium takamizusanense]|uniref:Elongation of fatty acids protein n=1 Tax=Purpureocillium takamizusanense TaxID=2060973 RepID=A0A9Q8V734_9HYPO|nr:Very-long-chain 3-oxoacyl-CoA synthase [Purpureocillium takamizusanense]UNI14432.1 Very-long-chain 3-oxoacyl-CoA synthase [Purpureocillium takamizusanense]
MAASGFSIMGAMPEPSLFSFPPHGQPAPLPPASADLSIMRPFNIPDKVFAAALDPRVPLTIAALYAVSAKALNKYNRSRNKQPWSISKTRPFRAFVVLHNVFLAVYSAWTFWGMLGGMRRSIVSPTGPGGLAATADSFCRLHGPAGLGRSIYYNETTGDWDSADPSSMASGMVAGNPSNLESGRLWNEGLAYYGWIFYLSKFYEVLDTFIILAKGKFSSTLQTYHHAGAMLCMWAGMRYMSAPIWMFVLINSFIHSLMYTYYTLTAFSIKVPMGVKRTLTTMQITQFLVGASYAMAHSFVTYIAPVTLSTITSAPVDVPAAPADSVLPTAAGTLDSLKKLIFGSVTKDAAAAVAGSVKEQTLTTETLYVAQPCIGTANETFAIWLNVLYLAPLTYLFVSFFIASYVKRSNAAQKANGKPHRRESNVALAEKAGWDAARGVEREVYGGENMLVDGQANGSASAVDDDEPPKANGKTRRRA